MCNLPATFIWPPILIIALLAASCTDGEATTRPYRSDTVVNLDDFIGMHSSVSVTTVDQGPAGHEIASVPMPPESETSYLSQESSISNDGLLPGHRIVAFYGNPRSARMGILGELGPDALLDRLRRQARAYEEADPGTPVLMALHLVTVVAQPIPGKDGTYRSRMPMDLVMEMSDRAERDSLLLILDIQAGRSSVEAELEAYREVLRKPWVHLALDPEFAMESDQVPGRQIGHLDALDVNRISELLSDIVEMNALPPKILIVHRFTKGMLRDADGILISPSVQVVVNMDGFGSPALKRSTYRSYVAAEPVQFTGFKLFYRQDHPLMDAGDVLALKPSPVYIVYQ